MNLVWKFSLSWIGMWFHSTHEILYIWGAGRESGGDNLNRLSLQLFLKHVSPMTCRNILSPSKMLTGFQPFISAHWVPGYIHSGLLIALGDDCYRNKCITLAEQGMIGMMVVATHVLDIYTIFRAANWDHVWHGCRYFSGSVLSL